VTADALLAERALAGDAQAREELIANIFRPLLAEEVLLQTVTAFLASGAALESTARALFVHANTVRYRLRRVSEVCGESATEPRGAFVIGIALALGRLADAAA
jgi:DNA-binding PucR family transcriptional regulator